MLQEKRKSINKLIGFIIFISILGFCIVFCSYLFRNTHIDVRQNILQLYAEPDNSIDIAVLGASSAYEFWNTMEIWDKYHITSFDYSGSGFCAASAIPCLEEIRKRQNPQLVLVEVRTLISRFYTDEINISTRNIFDSIDYGINRLKGYLYFADINGLTPSETLEGILDIMEYDDNYAALSNPINWQLADNRNNWDMADRQHYKGYCPRMGYNDFDYQGDWTYERAELDERAEKVIEDIIAYCDDNGIQLVLFASPMIYTRQDNMEYNAIADICARHNVPYFDGNKDFSDTEMSFSEDFYDTVHVNMNGSIKFTEWLASKIFDYYEIAPRTEEDVAEIWDRTYEKYAAVKTNGEESIVNKKKIVRGCAEMSSDMKSTKDVNEWLAMGSNTGFTIFTCYDIESFPYDVFDEDTKVLLKNYGIDETKSNENGEYLSIWRDFLIYQSTQSGNSYEGVLGSYYDDNYKFYWDGEIHLYVDKRHFDGTEIRSEIANLDPRLTFVAFNYYTNEIFDAVTVDYGIDGSISLRHLDWYYDEK